MEDSSSLNTKRAIGEGRKNDKTHIRSRIERNPTERNNNCNMEYGRGELILKEGEKVVKPSSYSLPNHFLPSYNSPYLPACPFVLHPLLTKSLSRRQFHQTPSKFNPFQEDNFTGLPQNNCMGHLLVAIKFHSLEKNKKKGEHSVLPWERQARTPSYPCK